MQEGYNADTEQIEGFDNTTIDDHADLIGLNSTEEAEMKEAEMNAMYEKQMDEREEPVNDTPQIDGIPNGDTMSDTSDEDVEATDPNQVDLEDSIEYFYILCFQ